TGRFRRFTPSAAEFGSLRAVLRPCEHQARPVSRSCKAHGGSMKPPPPAMATPTAPAIRPSSWRVALSVFRRRVRRRTLLRSGELLQPTSRFEQLLAVDVRVA